MPTQKHRRALSEQPVEVKEARPKSSTVTQKFKLPVQKTSDLY